MDSRTPHVCIWNVYSRSWICDNSMHLNIGRRNAVNGCNTILRWIHILQESALVIKKKPAGPTKTARAPENIVKVREAMVCCPERSEKRCNSNWNSDCYCNMLQNFLRPELRRGHLWMINVHFKQGGPTAHTSRVSMLVVWRMFLGRVISRFGDIISPN